METCRFEQNLCLLCMLWVQHESIEYQVNYVQKHIHTLWHSENSHRCKWNIHHIEPFLICLLHRKLTYPLKNSGSARQSCLSFSVLAPIFTVNIRSFSGEYTIWFPKPIGSMYGLRYIYPMYIYHKNQPTCRWIYHTWCLHGSYWKQNGFSVFFFPSSPTTRETEVDASWFLAWLMLEAVRESW